MKELLVSQNLSVVDSLEQLPEQNGKKTIRVHLGEIDPTTLVKFPFNIDFKERITPNGYICDPEIKLYESDGTFIKDAAGNVNFKVKYDGNSLYKYVNTNTDEGNKTDNKILYGGTNGGGFIQDANLISFMYKTRRTSYRDEYSFSPGYMLIRINERMI